MGYLRTIYSIEFAFLVFLSIIAYSLSLKCYKCSSILDERCGIDWQFEDNAGDKYKIQCHSQATACLKIVGEIQVKKITVTRFSKRDLMGSGVQHVYRNCWNMTTQESYTPTGCKQDEIRGGWLCRCVGNACNGQHPLAASGAVMSAMVICVRFLNELCSSI